MCKCISRIHLEVKHNLPFAHSETEFARRGPTRCEACDDVMRCTETVWKICTLTCASCAHPPKYTHPKTIISSISEQRGFALANSHGVHNALLGVDAVAFDELHKAVWSQSTGTRMICERCRCILVWLWNTLSTKDLSQKVHPNRIEGLFVLVQFNIDDLVIYLTIFNWHDFSALRHRVKYLSAPKICTNDQREI